MFSTVAHDLTYAIRQLRRNRGFTITVVLTLALGIGATTAIFSLVDGILLRPLPYPEAQNLVAINTLTFPPGVNDPAAADQNGTSYPDFFDWQRQTRSFESLAACHTITRLFSKMDGSNARVIPGARVSANLFPTLRVVPALGRNFLPDEELPGGRAVMLSHEIWISDFASLPGVIGQSIKISDVPFVIVGVMPANFHYPLDEPAFYWTTNAIEQEGPFPAKRNDNFVSVVGRLKTGVTVEHAKAEMNAVQQGLAQQYTEIREQHGAAVMPLLDANVAGAREPLVILFAAVGVVLLIGCANVAGLLLARATNRKPELALRAALGATRQRVVRQLLVESLILALLGGIAGGATAVVLLQTCVQFLPHDLPRTFAVEIDSRVMAFAIVLSAITTLLFGLIPALRTSRVSPIEALRDGGPNSTAGRHRNRLHHALVVGEIALGFTLLVGSGLLIHSLEKMLAINPGFDMERTVFFDVALTNARFTGSEKVLFIDKLLPKLSAIPGVEMVSAGHPIPLRWGAWTPMTIAGHPQSPEDQPSAVAAVTEPGYFETLSISLLRGRTFTPHDNNAKSAPVAVINRTFANKYFPGEDPIGRYFTPTFTETNEPIMGREIVGVVGDTRTGDNFEPYIPQFYLPYAQNPSHQRTLIVMKVKGDLSSYEETARKIVAGMDKDAPLFGYSTFSSDLLNDNSQPRFEAWVVSVFATIALFLSAVGLYAVLSYLVAERNREMGLRMALGASRADVLRLVMRRGLVLVCAGIAIGAIASIFAGRLLEDLLFNVTALDQ
ncbi:MAG TPA: ABC transporter permease, partial [Terriglobales bacterium]|nr:ABC transporter permease [Terriglobales bacterium]